MNERLNRLIDFLERDQDDPFLYYGIALEYLSLKEYSHAEKYFGILMEKYPEYVPAYIQYARLKELVDDMDAAKEIYRRGIDVARMAGDNRAANEMEDFLDGIE